MTVLGLFRSRNGESVTTPGEAICFDTLLHLIVAEIHI
jgi:hypothetical protein